MYYLKKQYSQAVNIISELGAIRRDQLIKTGVFNSLRGKKIEDIISDFETLSYNNIHCYFNILNDTYVALTKQEVDHDIIAAIDVMQHFTNVKCSNKGQYPFTLSFARIGDKDGSTRLFDVVVLKPGDEIIISRMLETKEIDRLLVVLDKKMLNDYKPLKFDGIIRYCVTVPDVKMFKSIKEAKDTLL